MNRNELTDLLTAAENDGPDAYALVCLLGLNGLRISEACGTDVTDIAGSRYQPTLQILGKGDKPAEVVLNPRTQHALDRAVADRPTGPLLRNQWRRRLQPHNASAILNRLVGCAGIAQHVTPYALQRSYITIGLLQGVPLRDMQRGRPARKAATTLAYDQSERSFHRPSSCWRPQPADLSRYPKASRRRTVWMRHLSAVCVRPTPCKQAGRRGR